MVKKPTASLQKIAYRPGEGYSVDMVVTSTEGNAVLGTLDFGSLPVPDRRYSCEAVGISVKENLVRILFGQMQPFGSGWLSLLVINMSFEAVEQMLDAVPPSFQDAYLKIAGEFEPGKITEFVSNAEQTVVLTASIVLSGYTGTNGCLDFYYASPFSVQQVAAFKKLSVEPVVRVSLPSCLVFAMIDGLRAVSKDFPKFTGLKKHDRI